MNKRFVPALALTAALAMSLAGCTGGGAAPSAEPSTEPSAEAPANTEPAAAEDVTIRYLIEEMENADDIAKVKESMATFEAANPGIKVQVDVQQMDQTRTVIQTQLRSGEGPDVFVYDTGPGFAGVLAEAGLLYDLSDVYTSNGWDIYPWAKERATYNGKTYCVPDQVEEVGLFVNVDLLTKNGLSLPANLAEFEAGLKVLKDAGVTPIGFGDQEGWEGGHILSMILAGTVGPDKVLSMIAGESSWDTPEVADAIDLFFGRYEKEGYVTPSAAGVTYDNSNAEFYAGNVAYLPTGTWLYTDIEANSDFQVEFIPFPTPNDAGAFAGGLGGGICMSAASKNPEATLKFLAWMQSPEHGVWEIETLKLMPAYPVDLDLIEVSPLFEKIVKGTAELSEKANGFGPNIDVMTSDAFNEAMWSGLQGVLMGQTTGAEVAKALQATYE
jgi:raffinose/stachyose/melibiose transport system substrate-binding protein